MISLKKLTLDDKEILAKLFNNKKIWDNIRDHIPFPYTVCDAEYFINLTLKEDKQLTFAITYNGDFCGVIGLMSQNDVHRKSMEIGFWIGEPYWGKGITSKALELTLVYAFEQFDINRIFARVFEHNKASMAVLLNNGFEQEGVLKHAVIKNNVICDEYCFGLLI